MNRGVLQSSPVQQMMVAGSPNSWWNMPNMRAAPPPMQQTSPFLAPPVDPSLLIPHYLPQPPSPPLPPPTSAPPSSGWTDLDQELPESWSQLLLGGFVGEDHNKTSKKLDNWEEQLLQQQQHHHHHPPPPHTASFTVDHHHPHRVKHENSTTNNFMHQYAHENAELIQTASSKPSTNWSTHQMMPVSPTSCVTTLSSSILDFSTNSKSDARHPPPDRSSECNTTSTGGVAKKAKIQSSSTQSTFKVKKEKLGDRITVLHQLVSPFGKTDTASVLLEAIGYIRFLQSQIEVLSLPYLGNKSGNNNPREQQAVQGERNCLFPEDPGQLLNDNCMKRKATSEQECELQEGKKELRSRGLCLVPLSCTMQVGSDNGADYWAPALGSGFR